MPTDAHKLWGGQLEAALAAVGLDGMIAGSDKDDVNIDKGARKTFEGDYIEAVGNKFL